MKNPDGKLPIGVEFNGVVHRDYELRPQLAEDELEIYDDPKHGARALKSPGFFMLCSFARRLEKLGDIPKTEITPEMMLKMKSHDVRELQAADRRGLPPEEPKVEEPA